MTDSVPAFDDIDPGEEQEYASDQILEFSRTDGLRIRPNYDDDYPSIMKEQGQSAAPFTVDEGRCDMLSRSSRPHFEWRRRIGTYIAREILHKREFATPTTALYSLL